MLKKLLQNEFLRNMMTLLSGSALAQLIPFLMLPVLQKWFYSPAQFGELALYTSVSMLLAQVAGFKYEFAIVKAESKAEAEQVFVGAMLISLFFSLSAAIFFNFFPAFAGRLFGISEIKSYFVLLPFSIFFFSTFEILNYWNNRQKKYQRIAIGKVSKTLAAESTKVGLANYTKMPSGLIIGRLTGEVVSFFYLLIRFLRVDRKDFHFPSKADMKRALKKHYRFPSYTMPSVFVGNLINLVFISLFTTYFGTGKAGVIGISVVYVSVAFGLISQSFSQVFYKEVSTTKGKDALLKLYLGNAKYLLLISLAAVIFVELIPSGRVANLLGEKWIDLMPTLKILVFGYAVSFISSSLSFIYMRINKQKQMLLFDVVHLAMVYASIWLGYHYFGTFTATLISYTLAQVLYYSFALIIAIVFIKNFDDEG